MNRSPHDAESKLARLLAASQAPADDAPLRRALAQLAARDAEPAWLRWLARPAALATACALLVVSVSASAWLLRAPSATSATGGALETSEVIAGLIGEDGSFGLVASDAGEAGPSSDSGGVR